MMWFCTTSPFFKEALVNHLSHIKQVDLEEEAQSAACYLVRGSPKSIAQFAPHRQPALPLFLWLEEKHQMYTRADVTLERFSLLICKNSLRIHEGISFF